MLYARNGSGLQINSLEAAKKAGRIGVVKDDVRHQFLLENHVWKYLDLRERCRMPPQPDGRNDGPLAGKQRECS